MQNFIPEEEIRRDQKIVDDSFWGEAHRRETQPIVIKREIGQKYGLEPRQCSKTETIAYAILLYLRTIRNQKASFTLDDIHDFYKLTDYLGTYDKLKPFLELESKSFIEFLLKHQYDYILSKCPGIKPYTLDNIDKITISRDLTNGSSNVKFQLERYKAIKKYYDETYGIKQAIAKETNKSKYDLEVLFSEETYEIREQLEVILEDFINMCYDTYVYQSPTHMKILQLSKKYWELSHEKNPFYNPHHVQDEEELRYINYRNALYPTTILYTHFQDINKKEQRIEYSIKYFNKQFNDLINKKIIRTLLDKDAALDNITVSELKKADFGYYFIINYGNGKLYANFLIQPESLDVSDMDEYVKTAYHLFPEHIHGDAINYVMKVTVRPLNKSLNEGFDFNQINLALDDFDDDKPIKNIKSKQVYNRDYTKEYLDLMRDTVDFNLPSGNLWYKCNLGAVNPTETALSPQDWYGSYYAWGELEPKPNYNEASYKFEHLIYTNPNNISSKIICEYTKYCHDIEDGYKGYTDNLTQLEPEDDAVHVKLGQNYWIPSGEDFDELFQYTTQEYMINYCHIKDLNGVLFIGKNDNNKTMFVPCAGLMCTKTLLNPKGESCIGFEVHLWTSSFDGDNTGRAISIVGKQYEFIKNAFRRGLVGSCKINLDEYRFFGLPLRPVYRMK